MIGVDPTVTECRSIAYVDATRSGPAPGIVVTHCGRSSDAFATAGRLGYTVAMGRVGVAVLLWSTIAGCGAARDGELLVDLHTDYAPTVEFDRVVVELDRDGLGAQETAVDPGADYTGGVRVAEFTDVSSGHMRVDVSLWLGRTLRIRHTIRVAHPGGTFGVAALITRSCEGVSCTEPGAAQCRDGRCVDERCAPTSPEFCPPPACVADEDCSSGLECARGQCVEGVCGEVLDDRLCGAGERCLRGVGCRPADGGDCARTLDCELFDAACLATLGRRCLAVAIQDLTYLAAVYDPDTGRSCTSTTGAEFPGGTSGAPQRFRDTVVTASPRAEGCALYSIPLDGSPGQWTPSPCGLPTLLTADSLAWIETVDTMGRQVVHLPDGTDLPFIVPDHPGSLRTIAPGEAALKQDGGQWQVIDVGTAALGERLTEPEPSTGLWRDPDTGGFLWMIDEGGTTEIVHTDERNAVVRRVPIEGLAPLTGLFNHYVGVGCAF